MKEGDIYCGKVIAYVYHSKTILFSDGTSIRTGEVVRQWKENN